MGAYELRVEVTDEDVRATRRLWLAALDDPAVSLGRTARLHEDLRLLIHAQAQQVAENFRAAQKAARRAAADELRARRHGEATPADRAGANAPGA